jgi:hypothetical protein
MIKSRETPERVAQVSVDNESCRSCSRRRDEATTAYFHTPETIAPIRP